MEEFKLYSVSDDYVESGEFLPYKWRILNSKGALAPLFSYKEK